MVPPAQDGAPARWESSTGLAPVMPTTRRCGGGGGSESAGADEERAPELGASGRGAEALVVWEDSDGAVAVKGLTVVPARTADDALMALDQARVSIPRHTHVLQQPHPRHTHTHNLQQPHPRPTHTHFLHQPHPLPHTHILQQQPHPRPTHISNSTHTCSPPLLCSFTLFKTLSVHPTLSSFASPGAPHVGGSCAQRPQLARPLRSHASPYRRSARTDTAGI